VRSLLEGLTNADRIVDLQRRLRLIPTDLNEYFERILFTVDNFYRKETAQMFQVTLTARDALSLMSYWYMDQEASFLENLKTGPVSKAIIDSRQAQMCKRLNACCKGLLEVQSAVHSPGQNVFFYLKVDFLHRTVRDFLRDPDMQNMLGKWVGTDFDANIAICQSLIAQVKTAPQDRSFNSVGGALAKIISLFFDHANVLEDSQYPLTLEARLLDDLIIALAQHKSYITGVESLFSISRSGVRNSNREPSYLVLEEAVQNGFHRYVSKKLDEWPTIPVIQQAELLHCALFPVASRPFTVPRLPMVVLLLEKGCGCYGPNSGLFGPAGDKTPWIAFLEAEHEDLRAAELRAGESNEDALPIIKDMLSHGADLNANCFLGDYYVMGGTHKASEVVRMLITDFDARLLGDLLTRTTDSQQGKSDRSRRKRFISMIFRGKRK
jgi:hypothetical protein